MFLFLQVRRQPRPIKTVETKMFAVFHAQLQMQDATLTPQFRLMTRASHPGKLG
jgi:hypothetical protein